MKYIARTVNGAFDLEPYENYLDRVRVALGTVIQGPDLLAIDRFVPTGPGSFHDSRFESLVVAPPAATGGEGDSRIGRVELCLKGPYFDRNFRLNYEGVVSCCVEAPLASEDLLMHEIRLEEEYLIHEIEFEKGRILIACHKLRFDEERLSPA